MIFSKLCSLASAASVALAANAKISPSGLYDDITSWLDPSSVDSQSFKSKSRLFDNINVEGSVKGLVVASPSKSNPDYFYHWTRDAGLTFDAIFKLYQALPDRSSSVATDYEEYFFQYIEAAIAQQNDDTAIAGLGEPKFYVDTNTGYTGAWGRPQNDGPAIRAFAVLDFITEYIKKGGDKDSILNSTWTQPIKADLDYVVSNWQNSNFDLWEEVQSDHFFTRMVQRKALLQGAAFANDVASDSDSASSWSNAASAINDTLSSFISTDKNLILNTLGSAQKNKDSFKDLSTILGVNHGYFNDGVFAPTNDWVVRTVYEVATSFVDVYSLSSTTADSKGNPLAPPTGRYPEDVYDGVGTSSGNPWFLSGNAFAEYFYVAAKDFQEAGTISVSELSLPFWTYYAGITDQGTISEGSDEFNSTISSLLGWGDAYFRIAKNWAGDDGHLSEEFNKDSGEITGAVDLTWSYASVITAAIARADVQGDSDYTEQLSQLQS